MTSPSPTEACLLILPALPWPYRKNGMSMRFGPIADSLAKRCRLDLLLLEGDPPQVDTSCVNPLVSNVRTLKAPRLRLWPCVRQLRTLMIGLSPWSLPFGALSDRASGRWFETVSSEIERGKYSTVVWSGPHCDIAFRLRAKFRKLRFVIDLVDSPTLLFSRTRQSSRVLRVLAPYTLWKWRRLERRIQTTFDATLYVSPVDASAATSDVPRKVRVVPNGVLTDDASFVAEPAPSDEVTIGFLGHMSYSPNVSAVLRLARDILPRIRRQLPSARLLVIGRAPAPEILALRGDGIAVTGRVESIWPYLRQVTVLVLPMVEGSGLQNKILDAMLGMVPVVATSIAVAGLGATPGRHLLVADSDADLAQACIDLMTDPTRRASMARAAREFVEREFSWSEVVKRYHEVVFGDSPP